MLGWGIGAAGMKAAAASREKVLLRSSLQKAQERYVQSCHFASQVYYIVQSAAGSANPDQVFSLDIFQGEFLDVRLVISLKVWYPQLTYLRSSAVFGVFLGIGSLFFAVIRAYYKSLIFMSIFGTISIDIFCVRRSKIHRLFLISPQTIGPLFPFTQYNILNALLIPVSIYIAIAVVVTVFVFPRTAHHTFLGTVTRLLGQIKLLLDAQEDLLTSVPGSITPGSAKTLHWRATRVSMFTIHQGRTFMSNYVTSIQRNRVPFQVTQQGKFVNAEFSWGRWNGDDARKLEEPLLTVISRMSGWYISFLCHRLSPFPGGLMSFINYIGRNALIRTASDSEPIEKTPQSTGLTDTFLLQQMYQQNEAGERQNSLRLVDLQPLLRDATSELRSAASDALTAVSGAIDFVNNTRWSWTSTADALVEQEQRLDSVAERLRSALAEFKVTGRLRLLEPFEPHLGTGTPPLRGLYVCYVFSTSIVVVSEAVLSVVETVQKISNNRRKNRLWAPKGLRQLAHAFFIEKSTEGDSRAYGEAEEVKEIDPEGDKRIYRQFQRRMFWASNSIISSQGVIPIADPQRTSYNGL